MRLIERRSRRRFRFSCAMIPSVGNPFEELDPTDFGSNGSALPAETGTAGLVGPMAGRHIPEGGAGFRALDCRGSGFDRRRDCRRQVRIR